MSAANIVQVEPQLLLAACKRRARSEESMRVIVALGTNVDVKQLASAGFHYWCESLQKTSTARTFNFQLSFRSAAVGDIPWITSSVQTAIRAGLPPGFESELTQEELNRAARLRIKQALAEQGVLAIAEHAGETVGYVLASYYETFAHLHEISVQKVVPGINVGRELSDLVELAALDKGVHQLRGVVGLDCGAYPARILNKLRMEGWKPFVKYMILDIDRCAS